MICDHYKPVPVNPERLPTLDRLRMIVAKYEPADNVFIRVEYLGLLVEAVDHLQSSINYEMDHEKIADARRILGELSG